MNLTLLIVVILTAIALVGIALGVARIVSPRSYNRQKGEAYECGIPTRGRSWMQFKAGYYLFVRCRSGISISLGRHRTGRRYRRIDQHFVFHGYPDPRISLCLEKRGTGMEVKKGKSKRLKAKGWR